MGILINDINYTIRQLIKNPGFTAVAVFTLALGIGAGTAVFSVVNAVLLRSLSVPNPHELRILEWTGTEPHIRSISGNCREAGNRITADSVSAPMFFSLRKEGREFADIFGFAECEQVTVRARGESFAARGMVVSDNFFSGLKARPFMGRLFAPGDAESGAELNVVITHSWWQRYFASDPGIVGQMVTLNGTNHTVVGVLESGFPGVQPNSSCGFYVIMAPQSQFLNGAITSDFHWWIHLMARLRPGVSDVQLKAALDVVFPREANAQMKEPEILVQSGRCGLAFDRNAYGQPLLLMLSIVILVMMVVCANLAGLSLVRGAARQHDLAVRAALGAGHWRLIRLSLSENFLLALVGGGLGILISLWGRTVISRLLAGSVDGLHYDFHFDGVVLGFSLAATLVTALLSGLLPAFRAARVDTLSGLKERGSASVRRLRTGRVLVAAQICLSLLLLFCAGLYVRTFSNLSHIDTGFDTERLLVFRLTPGGAGYDGARSMAFYEQVKASIAAMPGVSSTAFALFPLLCNEASSGGFVFPEANGRSPSGLWTSRLLVSDGFFSTMGIPILQGRALNVSDVHSVVVNEAFVRKYSPNENPIGRTIYQVWGAEWQIVGICRDAKYQNVKEVIPPTAYFSFRGRALPTASFVVRTKMSPLALTASMRKAVASVDPDVPVADLTTQEHLRAANVNRERFLVTLCGTLAALALLLSCIGLYGLMAYHVTRRTNEIAIRMAVGALPSDVARPVLYEALVLAAVGIATSLPMMLVASKLIRSQLYQVRPYDPVTFAAAIATLVAVALLAAWIPARRAAKIDPMEALRYE